MVIQFKDSNFGRNNLREQIDEIQLLYEGQYTNIKSTIEYDFSKWSIWKRIKFVLKAKPKIEFEASCTIWGKGKISKPWISHRVIE